MRDERDLRLGSEEERISSGKNRADGDVMTESFFVVRILFFILKVQHE